MSSQIRRVVLIVLTVVALVGCQHGCPFGGGGYPPPPINWDNHPEPHGGNGGDKGNSGKF